MRMKNPRLRFVHVIGFLLFAICAFTNGEAIAGHQEDTKHAIQTVTSPGHFVGVVKTLWNEDGRNMTLLEDFSYIDPDGLEWKAPAGSITDGASIPQSAWSIIGGPFEGPYRLAAVVHDVACVSKVRSWESVHEMFYRAMLTAHVDEAKAKIMYAAVYHFGPRWDLVKTEKGVPKADKDAVINTIRHSVQSTNSQVEVQAENSASGTSEDLTIRFIPPPNTFTESDFDSLKSMIETREKSNPGSVTLEQIRNYHTPEASR